jgi:hypothetical protein
MMLPHKTEVQNFIAFGWVAMVGRAWIVEFMVAVPN